jgi:hypothetical protein
MTQQHPIIPPPELVEQWMQVHTTKYDLARQAAQWGADQELEACCEWFQEFYKTETWVDLNLRTFRAARRPKPPSLKEQALDDLDGIAAVFRMSYGGDLICDKIRSALEALPND